MTSQHGEERILNGLLRRIGSTNETAVEFGAKDGLFKSNTASLRERGWRVFLFDSEPEAPIVTKAFITRENVNDVFASAGVPQSFDVLSIDIDGNDLWIWQALTYQPRIVVIEYNQKWPWDVSVTVPYQADRVWDHTDYYGASVMALYRLARRKRYQMVAATRSNLIFVQKGLVFERMRPWHVRVPQPGKPPDPLQRPWQGYR